MVNVVDLTGLVVAQHHPLDWAVQQGFIVSHVKVLFKLGLLLFVKAKEKKVLFILKKCCAI